MMHGGKYVAFSPVNLLVGSEENVYSSDLFQDIITPNIKYDFLPEEKIHTHTQAEDYTSNQGSIAQIDSTNITQKDAGKESAGEVNENSSRTIDTEDNSNSSSSSGSSASGSNSATETESSSDSDNIILKLHPTPMNSDMEDMRSEMENNDKQEEKKKERHTEEKTISTVVANGEEALLSNLIKANQTQIHEEEKLQEKDKRKENKEQKQHLEELIKLAREAKFQLGNTE